LFNSGIRPAINVGLSVSRVGGAAQIKATNKLLEHLDLILHNIVNFKHLHSLLLILMSQAVNSLSVVNEWLKLLKQPPYAPLGAEKQAFIIFAGSRGHLDNIEVKETSRFESELNAFVEVKYPEILEQIKTKKALDKDLEELLNKALNEFKATFAVK
jgi:F-type H+/Na+-transporting ATPase subunit alpha